MESFIFYLAIISASLGSGFQHGYNAAILNAPEDVMVAWIKSLGISYLDTDSNMTLYWACIVSSFTVGGMIGGFISPLIILIGGRRGGLIISAIVAIVAGVLMFISKMFDQPLLLMAGRTVSGINCGINGAICPIYVTEISPLNLRGAVGSLYQLFITAAILIAMVLSIEPALGTNSNWPYLFIIMIIIAILEILGLMWVPESPKYILDKKNDEAAALKAFNRFHGKKVTAAADFAEIKASSDETKQQAKITIKIFFKNKMYYKPLALCVFLMIAQQMSGINAVIFYSTNIFQKANMSKSFAQICTGIIGLVNFLATVVSVAIIDKIGRKPLLVWGFIVMIIATGILMGILYLTDTHEWARWICLTVVLIFIISFAVGAGPIPWMFSSEVFMTNARPLAGMFIVPTNWFFNLLVGVGFPPLQEIIGPLVFIIFLACQVVSTVIILLFMPETKNRPVEEIIKTFQ